MHLSDSGNGRLATWAWVVVALTVLAFALTFCHLEPNTAYAQGSPYVTVRVADFGRPMEPLSPVFTNDPERIVLSKNFYSTQPGARQNRYGVKQAFNYSSLKTQAADAITTLESTPDSSAFVFAAGGKWWWTFYGLRKGGVMDFVTTPATPREVRPYTPGTIVYVQGTRDVQGSGTQFTRFLQPGDTLYVDSLSKIARDTFIVRYIISDIWVVCDTVNNVMTHTVSQWNASRTYQGSDPFLYTSGSMAYSGSTRDKPQVIFNKDDSVFIRPLIMVDSIRVDAISDLHWIDTTTSGDEVMRSYSTAGTDTVVEMIQLISRRAGWFRDQWVSGPDGEPSSYFVRLGWHEGSDDSWGRFYTIRGNSDTSMYLSAWYWNGTMSGVNTNTILQRNDSMVTADVAASPWAYIYTATGFYDIIVEDAQTDTATLYGRGAIWKVRDPGAAIMDTLTVYNNLCYLHLTRDDVSFPAYTVARSVVKSYTVTRLLRTFCPHKYTVQSPLTQAELPPTDSIWSYEEFVQGNAEAGCFGDNTRTYGTWRVRSIVPQRDIADQFVTRGFFPIRFMRHSADTTYFNISTADFTMVLDTVPQSTVNWEIVKVGMPDWAGMTSWSDPPQLVAWGDTSSPSLLSSTLSDDPWNWPASRDMNVGPDLQAPVVGCLGFDDQLLAFKHVGISSWDDQQLREISNSDGLVSRDALTADNKMAYWLDIDGPKSIQRRDFAGYSIQKIGKALDPVFNSWSQGFFGTSVVPFSINPAYRNQAVLEHNKFDQHLYLWFAEGSSTTNNRCLTYDLTRQAWDGFFTLGASAAMSMTWDDTASIVYTEDDTARVMRTTSTFNDANTGIQGELKSGKFWLTRSRESAWPISSRFIQARVSCRGSDLLFDTLYLIVSANLSLSGVDIPASADTITIDLISTVSDGLFTYKPSQDLVGTYWDWKIYYDGGTTGSLLAPYELLLDFAPVAEDK